MKVLAYLGYCCIFWKTIIVVHSCTMSSDYHVLQAADRAAGLQLLEAAIRACGTATFLKGFLGWSVRLLSIIRNNKADHQVRRQASNQRQHCGLP